MEPDSLIIPPELASEPELISLDMVRLWRTSLDGGAA